jgi:hypothetical protein
LLPLESDGLAAAGVNGITVGIVWVVNAEERASRVGELSTVGQAGSVSERCEFSVSVRNVRVVAAGAVEIAWSDTHATVLATTCWNCGLVRRGPVGRGNAAPSVFETNAAVAARDGFLGARVAHQVRVAVRKISSVSSESGTFAVEAGVRRWRSWVRSLNPAGWMPGWASRMGAWWRHCEYSPGAVVSVRTSPATAPRGVRWGGVPTEAAAEESAAADG